MPTSISRLTPSLSTLRSVVLVSVRLVLAKAPWSSKVSVTTRTSFQAPGWKRPQEWCRAEMAPIVGGAGRAEGRGPKARQNAAREPSHHAGSPAVAGYGGVGSPQQNGPPARQRCGQSQAYYRAPEECCQGGRQRRAASGRGRCGSYAGLLGGGKFFGRNPLLKGLVVGAVTREDTQGSRRPLGRIGRGAAAARRQHRRERHDGYPTETAAIPEFARVGHKKAPVWRLVTDAFQSQPIVACLGGLGSGGGPFDRRSRRVRAGANWLGGSVFFGINGFATAPSRFFVPVPIFDSSEAWGDTGFTAGFLSFAAVPSPVAEAGSMAESAKAASTAINIRPAAGIQTRFMARSLCEEKCEEETTRGRKDLGQR